MDPAELVLEYLAAKGFTNAEMALREQLDSEPAPLPATEQCFSQLESLLIRGANAGPARPSGGILEDMRAPVAKASASAEETSPSPTTHAVAPAAPTEGAGTTSTGAVTMRWHDPDADGEADEWTDDEALGYVQIECSEEALVAFHTEKGFQPKDLYAMCQVCVNMPPGYVAGLCGIGT